MATPMMQRTAEPTNKYGLQSMRVSNEGGAWVASCERDGCHWHASTSTDPNAGAMSRWTDMVNGHTHRKD